MNKKNIEPLELNGDTLVLTQDFKQALTKLNNEKTEKKLSIGQYVKKLNELCGIEIEVPITVNYKRFLGGFILGEGSLNSSIKKKEVALGLSIDLEFSVTQAFVGVSPLINLLLVFQTGRISYKSGSNRTLVFIISNRQSIFEKVFPFWEQYIFPFQGHSREKKNFLDFKKYQLFFNEKCHLDKDLFLNKMLPLWDRLRKQKGQKNETFGSLEEAKKYILDFRKKGVK